MPAEKKGGRSSRTDCEFPNMFNLGPQEILLILLAALLIFGPSKLVDLAKSLGKAGREFRKSFEGKEEDESDKSQPLPPSPPQAG